VPIDFERQGLADGLKAAGFQANQPANFHWLGVVTYLTRNAILTTLSFVVGIPEAEVVFDYSEPIENYPSERGAYMAALAARAAAIGEPWLSHFNPSELSRELHGLGFGEVEDLGIADVSIRYFGIPSGEIKGGPGPHIIRARRIA
jgi:O-methyltransferase involved in polyketide biosynthesis